MMAKKDQRAKRLTRPDWEQVNVPIMRWCLRVKRAQTLGSFFETLLGTGSKAIVERSRKDPFWGAVLKEDGTLHGENQLGQLLVELRNDVRAWLYAADDDEPFPTVQPPAIPDFRLLGQEIGPMRG
jgi:predicted NAD-dependent protein-ADP-ribosyltransferase YbiA (DUF1768 family)